MRQRKTGPLPHHTTGWKDQVTMWPRTRRPRPPRRLCPQLDDSQLARALTHLEAQIAAQGDNLAEANDRGALTYPIEQALRDPGHDWDRRMHRLLVFSALPQAPVLARQWRNRDHTNADALLLQVFADLHRARATGAGLDIAGTVNLCRRAAELVPPDPAPWIALLSCQRLQRAPGRAVQPVWEAVKARDPWNREAHLQMLHYVSPEECGSNALTVQFLDSVAITAPSGSPVTALGLTSSLDRYRRVLTAGGIHALTAHRHWNQPQELAVVDQALKTWPQPGYLTHAAALADLNLLAYVLMQATRPREAWPVFEAISAVATSWPWELDGDPLQQIQREHRRAFRARIRSGR
ncbi:hypothetical protein GR925_22500 [Streptomyces sp. HUCO-GS316]|uniref:hypothetical protein n=1 Tax=Streptomyces sp. HUCO-GS316 TaxID=2692198 RepID=UPI001370C27A|nr:hypothetical protein [Streptomyces sp. HUCO-GS316]MXM66136.1 hypothetical protein [Streptomyces sp. HUCO-GS316]